MDQVSEELLFTSQRHSATFLRGQSWYRIATWEGVHLRKHMFHSPFERPAKSYRFSASGRPALYLANSVYLCWRECGEPDQDKCLVSRFEVDATGFEYLDLPTNHDAYLAPLAFPECPGLDVDPRRVMNSPYVVDVVAELAEYLTLWPLLASMTILKSSPTTEHPAEYLLPQMLTQWTRRSERFLGIRYFTSKLGGSTNSNDWEVSLVIPARTRKATGFCDFLQERVRCTEPQPLEHMSRVDIPTLLTDEAADRRQGASGRYMLQRSNGTVEEYAGTSFGKMEYWLDRTDYAVGRIEPD